MPVQIIAAGIIEGIVQPLVDLLNSWGIPIGWNALTWIIEAIVLIIIFMIIRYLSKRRSIKIKLTAQMLDERGVRISGETLAGLKALLISTRAAMQTLEALQAKNEIGGETFDQLSRGYKEQLVKIEEKFTEELDAAERDRLRQLYDKSLRPTAAIAPAPAPTPPTGPPTPPTVPPTEPPSGPPAPPSGIPEPPTTPPAPPSGIPEPPTAPPTPPSVPPATPSAPP